MLPSTVSHFQLLLIVADGSTVMVVLALPDVVLRTLQKCSLASFSGCFFNLHNGDVSC